MNRITMAHGSGGAPMHTLIKEVVLKELHNPILDKLADSALLKIGKSALAFTTDSYVVRPLFFPGGDIGRLAVYGTVNDLAVCGARPLFISCGIIMEEGLDIEILKRVIRSMKKGASVAGVYIVTGDIKVVERGKCDQLYINTSGLGVIEGKRRLSVDNIRVGDRVILSGSIADHGISVLAVREGVALEGALRSDAAPLNKLIAGVLKAGGARFMRDPTRGGVAATLNEVTQNRKFGIIIDERSILVKPAVSAAVELLGLDPLYIANEGKVLVITSKESASKVLGAMRKDRSGRNARVVGEVTGQYKGKVVLKTKVGGARIVEMPTGENLPRIC